MAGWFQNLIPFVPGTDILASEVDAKLDSISKSLNDHLPDPRSDGVKGFSKPCAVGDATEDYHAVNASQAKNISIAIDSGAGNAYQLTPDVLPSSYVDGYEICFKPLHANTGTSTAQVGTLGAVPLKKTDGSDLVSGDLVDDAYYSFRFNGTEFRLETMTSGDFAYIHSERVSAENSAAEAKQWAIGDPSEPAEHSAKYWALQAPNAETLGGYPLDHTGVPLLRGYRNDGKIFNDNSDLNTIEINSVHNFDGGNTQHSPDSHWGFVTTYIHGNYSSSNAWRSQLSIGMQTNDSYHRYGNPDGTWQPWVKFINSGNFNTYGDARYLRLSGGSLANDLNVNGKFKISGNDAVTYDTTNHHVIFGDTLRRTRLRGTVTYLDSYQTLPRSIWYDGDIFTAQDDNICSLGFASARWTKVFAVNGTIDTSDERLKDIQDLGDTSWIYDLEPIVYIWKDKPTGTRYGFGAQTTYSIMPDKTANLVDKPDIPEDPWGMQPDQLIPLLLNEMKILRQRIEQLEAK